MDFNQISLNFKNNTKVDKMDNFTLIVIGRKINYFHLEMKIIFVIKILTIGISSGVVRKFGEGDPKRFFVNNHSSFS